MVRVIAWFKGMVISSRSSFAFLSGLLTIVLTYRLRLTIDLFTQPIRPFDFDPMSHPLRFMISYWLYDAAFVLGCFLFVWFISHLHHLLHPKMHPVSRIFGVFLLQTVLLALAFLYTLHSRLLFTAQTGAEWSILKEGLSDTPVLQALAFGETKDWFLVLLPVALFWFILLGPSILSAWIPTLSFAILLVLSSASLCCSAHPRTPVPKEIRIPPGLALLSDLATQTLFEKSSQRPRVGERLACETAIEASASATLHTTKHIVRLPRPGQYPWNIVLFVMESVGTRYIFEPPSDLPMPMPFLHSLAQRGWYLKKHYTTSNVSTKAVFSILSGLYDLFQQGNLGLRRDVRLPSLFHFLAQSHEAFLVTPSSISWYFPQAFVKNSGLTEIHSYENLPFPIKETYHPFGHYIARDEIKTIDFFIRRMKRAREPFLAIYISFAAHFPYFDYGEDYRIVKEDGHAIGRYYNNLRLLDSIIQRVYEQLLSDGSSERTILVVVGDHGQAFGQHHPDNFMHHRYSYNENLETPAIFYQPRLFRPTTFEFATSHVDILPTLLDALGISYHPSQFDGESLFREPMKRKHIFFCGHEGSFSLLGADGIKVQYSLKKNRCWAFDLKADPDENHPLDCSSYQSHVETLFNFVTQHDAIFSDALMRKGIPRGQPRIQ